MNYKNIVEKMAIKLGLVDFKFEDFAAIELKLFDGTIVYTMDKLDLGSVVTSDMELTQPLNDGEYELEDKTKFTILDGVVSAIVTPEIEEEEPEVEVVVEAKEEVKEEIVEEKKYAESELVDGVKIYYNTLEVGQKVFSDPEMVTPQSDGEYVTVDGEVLVITDGAISDLKSVIDVNQELKKIVKENELELSDLKKELNEITVKLTEMKETVIKQKEEFSRKSAAESLNFSNAEIEINKKDEIRLNRMNIRQNLKK